MYRVFGSECPQCGADIIAPERSEHVCDHCIRHTWSCDACGGCFEDLVHLPAAHLTVASSAHGASRQLAVAAHFLCRAT